MTMHTLYPGFDPGRDHWRGSTEDQAVTVTIFGDYECPATRGVWSSVELLEQDEPQFRFVFRHFPLTEIHPRALAAAGAAEAAAEQRQFWQMNELLLGHQNQLEQKDLTGYGRQLGLNLSRYEVARNGNGVRHRIAQDRVGGARSGVDGTPTIFVDGQRYRGKFGLSGLLDAATRVAMRSIGRNSVRAGPEARGTMGTEEVPAINPNVLRTG